MASFSPSGYAYRFNAFANVLASLFDVADDTQCDKVDTFIVEHIINDDLPLLLRSIRSSNTWMKTGKTCI